MRAAVRFLSTLFNQRSLWGNMSIGRCLDECISNIGASIVSEMMQAVSKSSFNVVPYIAEALYCIISTYDHAYLWIKDTIPGLSIHDLDEVSTKVLYDVVTRLLPHPKLFLSF